MLHLRFCLFVWLMSVTVGTAQHPPRLPEQTDPLVKARQAERQALAKNDSLGLAEAWFLHAKAYVLAGNFATAQRYFLKSLRVLEPRGDSFELSRLYFRLSETEIRLHHDQQALQYATQSMRTAQRIHSDSALNRAYSAMARVYESQLKGPVNETSELFKRILFCYNQRDYLSTRLNDTLGVAEASLELGTLYTQAGNPQKAIPYLQKAVTLSSRKNKDIIVINSFIHLANAYLAIRKPAVAFRLLQNAQQRYDRNRVTVFDVRLELERSYVNYYRLVGQWKGAHDHLQIQKELEQSQLMADNNGTITRLYLEYETEKKEVLLAAQRRELSLRDQNLHIQQRFTTASLVLLLGAVGVSIVFFRLYRKNQRISRQNETLVKEQNHRVKNNLQVVASLLSLQARQLTDETARRAVLESRLRVESMSIIHRRLYDGDRLAQVHVPELMQELVHGVLRAYGFPAVQTEWMIDDFYLPADKAIPLGLILNELTTNACKYAFPGHPLPRFSVHFYRRTNTLHLTVSDNGPGPSSPGLEGPGLEEAESDFFGPKKPELPGASTDSLLLMQPRVSFGMSLIQAQVAQLYGTYTFSVPMTGTGVLFTMEFTD